MTYKPENLGVAGKTIVITGATSGIGLEAARIFSRNGARVVAAVRNRDKAASVIDFQADIASLDLGDLPSVHAFASNISGPIDVLINNAGIMAVPFALTKDGFESQIGTNHLGHFALTNLLLPRVTDRVVTVSSTAHKMGKIRLDDLNWQRNYQRWLAYGQSKLANLLFTKELQRRLDLVGSPIRAMTVHPGYANTNLQAKSGKKLQDSIMARMNRWVAQSAYMGSLPTVYAATADIPGDSFVGPDGIGESRGWPTLVKRSKAAQDEQMAQALWKLSEELTGVRFPL